MGVFYDLMHPTSEWVQYVVKHQLGAFLYIKMVAVPNGCIL